MVQRRYLEVEVLETRQVPAGIPTPSIGAPPPPPPAVTPIDPTLTPATPTNTTVQVQITALGPVVNGRLSSITVQGLSSSNLQGAVPMGLQIGSTTYAVDSVTVLASGECRLTVLGGIDPAGVAVGGTARVILGSGSYVPTITSQPAPTAPPPDSVVSPIDPTTMPFTP